MTLQHFDLVTIGILDEEELRHQAAVSEEFLDVSGLQASCFEPRMLTV